MQQHQMLWFLDNSEGMSITKQHNLCVCWGEGNFQKLWLCNLLKNENDDLWPAANPKPCQTAPGLCVLLWLQQCCHFPGHKYTCYATTLPVHCLGKYPPCLMSFSSIQAMIDIVFLSWRIKWRPAPTVHTFCKIHQQHYFGVQTMRDLIILSTKTIMTNYCIQLEPL